MFQSALRIEDLHVEVDGTEILARLRAVKSPSEQALMQRAIDITASGYSGSASTTKVAFGSADGTSTAADLYLNVAVTSAKASASGTVWVTGTVVVDWYNIGDV